MDRRICVILVPATESCTARKDNAVPYVLRHDRFRSGHFRCIAWIIGEGHVVCFHIYLFISLNVQCLTNHFHYSLSVSTPVAESCLSYLKKVWLSTCLACWSPSSPYSSYTWHRIEITSDNRCPKTQFCWPDAMSKLHEFHWQAIITFKIHFFPIGTLDIPSTFLMLTNHFSTFHVRRTATLLANQSDTDDDVTSRR